MGIRLPSQRFLEPRVPRCARRAEARLLLRNRGQGMEVGLRVPHPRQVLIHGWAASISPGLLQRTDFRCLPYGRPTAALRPSLLQVKSHDVCQCLAGRSIMEAT
jgi:hypothetical protein